MSFTRKVGRGAVVATLAMSSLIAAPAAFSASAEHFKTYGAGQPKQNEMEFVYWFNYVAQSDFNEQLQAHTLELEYGLTNTWAIGFYGDWEKPKGESLQYVQTRAVVSRFKLFQNGERFFDAGVYFEYYVPREAANGGFTGDKLEARIILQKETDNWDLRLNPKFEKGLSGNTVEESVEFEYAAALFRKLNNGFYLGLESYGNMGEVAHMIPSRNAHYLVPSAEINLAPELWMNVGVAFGITDAADDVTLKTYIEYEF